MSLWEFRCVSNGWRKAQGGDGDGQAKAPTEEEFYETLARLDHLI